MDLVSLLTWPILVLQVVVVVPITLVKVVMAEVNNMEGDMAVVILKEDMVEATEAADM